MSFVLRLVSRTGGSRFGQFRKAQNEAPRFSQENFQAITFPLGGNCSAGAIVHPSKMAFSTSASAAKKKEEKGTATSGVDGVLVQDSREANICRMLKTWIDVKDESGFRGHFVSGQKGDDLDALVNHFTAPALARALRDREETLAHCAQLVATGSMQELKSVLEPFGGIKPDRKQRIRKLIMPDLNEPGGLFQESVLERLKVRLNRLPREITKRARLRACVVLPMCLVKNEPSILFTKRSDDLRRHKGEVCFPGGMVDDVDYSIVDAGLRELHEEIGIEPKNVDVLGILRCDWGEVHSLTGVAVTPVCGYLGSIDRTEFKLNPSEVENCFTVPVVDLLDKSNWSMQRFNAPVFRVPGDTDEKKVVWGLTGYILHRFTKLLPSIVFEKDGVNRSFSFAN